MPQERLYIKVILPKQYEERKDQGGGGKVVPFKPVTPELRRQLVSRIEEVETLIDNAPERAKAIPVRVTLEEKARAKSHRPDNIFSQETCPIIGAGEPGELYVRMTHRGVVGLKAVISQGDTPMLVKAISTIHSIQSLMDADRLAGMPPEEVFKSAPSRDGRRLIKVKLFDYGDPDIQDNMIVEFEALLFKRDIKGERLLQFKGQDIYAIECRSVKDVRVLANAIMVRSVVKMPVFRTLRDSASKARPLPSNLPMLDADPKEYPIVAVVDSGVSSKIPAFEPWIYKRERTVSPAEENTSHGTFVAGLITWGHIFNSSIPGVGVYPCRILDIHVLPNSDPSYGRVGFITEYEMLQSLEDYLLKYANEVKVWNLSLGSDEVCSLDCFSDFAVELDNLQEKYGVTFVIAAGNYNDAPLPSYPRSAEVAEAARITAPADSVLGITVGSIAQVDHPDGTKKGEPSPFSRNGPGPNFIIKPDFAHCGGNTGKNLATPSGVSSVNETGWVGENIGTSFATPFVSRPLAYTHHLITPAPSPTIARAILTHNARDIRTMERVKEGDDQYIGFGTPLDVDQSLACDRHSITLVFEEIIRPGYKLEWDYFPYPESLIRGGKFFGEISMTLVYHPKRNPSWGSEYCETYLDAHFGVIRDGKDKDGNPKEEFKGQVPFEHNELRELYEYAQIEQLRKWAPVRTYHRVMPGGVMGKRWKLTVEMLCRHDVDLQPLLQPFALILTISDPKRKALVYDEMARILRNRFRSKNLELRPSVQVRTRS